MDMDRDYLCSWLRDVGEAFLKERQRDFGALECGGGSLTLEYPTMADAHAAALHIEVFKRIVREDGRATAEEAGE